MERIDYVKCAIANDREMYEHAKTDARSWATFGEAARALAANDFSMLYGKRVGECFPWLRPSGDEIREGYREAVGKIVEDELPELVMVRSGSAIYWDAAKGRYLVCQRDDCGDGLEVVQFAETAREALLIADDRAGFCRPVEDAPEHLAA